MDFRHLQISHSLEEITKIGIVFLKEVENAPTSEPLARETESLAGELRGTIGDRKLSEIESVQRVRQLYHRLGIDPTRERPPSERLLRQAIRGRPLPRINKLVDAVNHVSLRLQCPLGVYDWDKIAPPVLVRMGRPDEGFHPVARPAACRVDEPRVAMPRRWIKLHGHLTLVDGEGLFGSPGHESDRTSVDPGTVRAMVVAWTAAGTPRSYLDSVLEEVRQVTQTFCGAKVAAMGVL